LPSVTMLTQLLLYNNTHFSKHFIPQIPIYSHYPFQIKGFSVLTQNRSPMRATPERPVMPLSNKCCIRFIRD
jgi:hypothetical protein